MVEIHQHFHGSSDPKIFVQYRTQKKESPWGNSLSCLSKGRFLGLA